MKVRMDSADLVAAINRLERLWRYRQVEVIRLETDGVALLVSATDRQNTVTVRVEGEVREAGDALVEPGHLRNLLAVIDGDVQIDTGSPEYYAVIVHTDRCRYRLMSARAVSWNPPEVGPYSERISVRAELGTAIDIAIASMAVDRDVSARMDGLRFERADGRIRVIATDGVQLSLAHAPGELPAEGFTVHRYGAREVHAALASASSADLSIVDGHLVVVTDRETVEAALIDKSYPDYTASMPTSPNRTARVPREPMLDALRRMEKYVQLSLVARGVHLDFGGGRLTVRRFYRLDGPREDACDVVDGVEFAGEPIVVAVDPGRLRRLVEATPGDTVELRMAGPLHPIFIPLPNDGAHLLMPQRSGRVRAAEALADALEGGR